MPIVNSNAHIMYMRPILLATPWKFGYTWVNMYLLLLCITTKSRHLKAIVWSNSLAIMASYEYFRLRFPQHMRPLAQRLHGGDIAAHLLPLVVLFNTPTKKWHAASALGMHVVWGLYHKFDIQTVYKLHAPLQPRHLVEAWIATVLCHTGAIVAAE